MEQMIDGRLRSWIYYIPKNLENPAPLVLGLSGSVQTAAGFRKSSRYRLEELAEKDGAIIPYVHGWEEGNKLGSDWNDCRAKTRNRAHFENVDDVGFLLGLLEQTSMKWNVDRTRVYSIGVSDGGDMTYRMATEHPEKFAAVAVIAAQQAHPDDSNCNQPRGPVPILVMNGTDDPVISFEGGELGFKGFKSSGRVMSMDGTADHWKRVNRVVSGCQVTHYPDLNQDDGSTVKRINCPGPDGNDVVIYEIHGGGHSAPGMWTGLPSLIFGNTNMDVVAMDEIWQFFMQHP